MILHVVKCEMCDKQFEFNPMERPIGRSAPDSWVTLFPMKDMQGSEGWHFCSPECLYHWTEVKIAVGVSSPVESPYIRREEG